MRINNILQYLDYIIEKKNVLNKVFENMKALYLVQVKSMVKVERLAC